MSGPDAPSSPTDTQPDRNAQAALAVFVLLVAVAGPLILYWNRRQWFFLDEWDFLAGRQLSSVHDLLTPHNEHWSTIPIVLYRVLWRFVGLHHYWPYQVPVVAAHLAVCVLMRVIMRRAGVDPWIATVAAVSLLFFGRGREDLAWGFQIGFTGALAFGLAHLLAADHEGRFNRRDLVGLAAGLGALLCSGVGVAMVAVVGMSTLLRRGWRAALAHVMPLAVIYVAWQAAFPAQRETVRPSAADTMVLFRRSLVRTISGLGGSLAVGVLLVVLLGIGAVELVRRCGWRGLRGPRAPVVAMAVGAAVFAAIVAPGRAALSLEPAGRYLHILAVLLVPALALAATEVARDRRWAYPVVLVLLAAGIPSNLASVEPGRKDAFTLGNREQLLVLAEVALTSGAPRDLRLQPGINDGVTVGWLSDGRRGGRIPPPSQPMDPRAREAARLQMALLPLEDTAPGRSCRPVGAGANRLLEGDLLTGVGQGSLTVTKSIPGLGPVTVGFFVLSPAGGSTAVGRVELQVLRPLDVTVTGTGTEVQICRG